MLKKGLTNLKLEWMCQDLCFILGKNSYEELGLKAPQFCDLSTVYREKNFLIEYISFCDEGYEMRVFYKMKRVLSSKRGEKFPVYFRRVEDFMSLLKIDHEEARRKQESGRNIDDEGYEQIIEINEEETGWIGKLEKLWKLNPERTMINLTNQQHLNH